MTRKEFSFAKILLSFLLLSISFQSFSHTIYKFIVNEVEYCISPSTILQVKLINDDRTFRVSMRDIDSNGITFGTLGMTPFDSIETISFRPFSKQLQVINALYFTGAMQVIIFYSYESFYINDYTSRLAGVTLIVTSPVWGILMPAILNLSIRNRRIMIDERIFRTITKIEYED